MLPIFPKHSSNRKSEIDVIRAHLRPWLPRGTTTRARLTLLDACPGANETPHSRLSQLDEVLAVRSSVSQPFL